MKLKLVCIMVLVASLSVLAQEKKSNNETSYPKKEIKIEYSIVGEKDGIKVILNLDNYLKTPDDMYKVFGSVWNKSGKTMSYSKYNTFNLFINDKMLIIYIDHLNKMYSGGYTQFSIRVNEDDYPNLLKNIQSAKGEIHIGIRKLTIPLELQKTEVLLKK